MHIGIIGAGFIGRAVAQLFIAAGHEVMLSNSRGPQTLTDLLTEIPGVQIGTIKDAAAFGEVVLVAIPFKHYQSLPAEWLQAKRYWMPTITPGAGRPDPRARQARSIDQQAARRPSAALQRG